ncbi:MAG: hypothetical protein KDC57_10355 [Saprospiraceae bacterium]|nr:hypothetical protein [Saprospiraceae bacterium]
MPVRKIILCGVIAGIAASVAGCTIYCLMITGILSHPLLAFGNGTGATGTIPGLTTLFLYLKTGLSASAATPMALTADLGSFGSLTLLCAAISGIASFWKEIN